MFSRRAWSSSQQTRVVNRSFKNFGHVREKTPVITVAWHTLLTVLFIGAGIEWKRMYGILAGEDDWKVPRDPEEEAIAEIKRNLSQSVR